MRALSKTTIVACGAQDRVIGSNQAHAMRATVMWKFQTPLVLGPASAGTPRANASSAMRALSKTTIVACAAQDRVIGSNQAHAMHATVMWKFQTRLVLGPASVGTPRANASSAMRALSKTTIVVCAAQDRVIGSNQAH